MSTKLCCRTIYILNQSDILYEETQQRLLDLVESEDVPNLEMSPEDIRSAYPAKNTYEIQIIYPTYHGFDRNQYLALGDIAAASNVTACNSAVESIHRPHDDSDSGKTIYRAYTELLTEQALVEFYLSNTDVR